MKPLIIVTRPAEAGERLQRRLAGADWTALWLPAFDIGPAPDIAQVRAALSRLADFDLAVFVSPAAVRAVAAVLEGPWPLSTAIGAVGAATGVAARAALRPPAGTAVIAPAADDAAGSEAFWSEWSQRGQAARRVLLLRAQQGREWLADRFAATGAAVEVIAVYTRTDREAAPSAQLQLHAALAAAQPVIIVFSSSEAVAALDRQLTGIEGARVWLRQGAAVATHERIRDRLLDAGYTRVELSSPADDDLIARLESL